jgi:flagellar biosynthesis/type III secretory pathway M-ring protein FliF/YscJ
MMRKASNVGAKMPSAEELAGIPPAFGGDDDVVGEADEIDAALTGIELDDNQIRSRTLVEQVKELVNHNPDEAAMLVSRWVKRND